MNDNVLTWLMCVCGEFCRYWRESEKAVSFIPPKYLENLARKRGTTHDKRGRDIKKCALWGGGDRGFNGLKSLKG
jgi:hypothetical protein